METRTPDSVIVAVVANLRWTLDGDRELLTLRPALRVWGGYARVALSSLSLSLLSGIWESGEDGAI